MKRFFFTGLALVAIVVAAVINLTLNKAGVLAQNQLMLENIEAITAAETREEAEKACRSGIVTCTVIIHYLNGVSWHNFSGKDGGHYTFYMGLY